jgi:hypothetical protein
MQGGHLRIERLRCPAVVDDVVRRRETLLTRSLRVDHRLRERRRHIVARDRTRELDIARQIDDKNAIDPVVASRFDEKRDHKDHVRALRGIGAQQHFRAHAWMQDGLESSARFGVAEDERAHFGAFERAARVEHLRAERCGDLVERRHAGLHELARDDVGVDDGGSDRLKATRDLRFPAGDAAG